MRAVGVTEFGGPEALHVVEVPEEHAGPGQVRLRVTAATVNPTDTYLVLGAYAGRDPAKQPPWVPGMDVAGVVDVVADASEADEQLVRDLGADVVVRRGDDVAQRIREQFPDGVDGLADGAVQDSLVLPAVRDGGAVTTVRGYRGDGRRDLRGFPVLVRRYAEEAEGLDRLREQVEKGEL